MSILDDFQQGTGMFGFTAMRNERSLAKQLGPSLAHLLGTLGASGVAAEADVAGNLIRERGMEKVTGMKEAGDTLRQQMITDASKILEDMRQTGMTKRTGMEQSGATYRTKLTGEDAMARLLKEGKIRSDILDQEAILRQRMLGAARPGSGMSAYDLLDTENIPSVQSSAKKKEEESSPYWNFLAGGVDSDY